MANLDQIVLELTKRIAILDKDMRQFAMTAQAAVALSNASGNTPSTSVTPDPPPATSPNGAASTFRTADSDDVVHGTTSLATETSLTFGQSTTNGLLTNQAIANKKGNKIGPRGKEKNDFDVSIIGLTKIVITDSLSRGLFARTFVNCSRVTPSLRRLFRSSPRTRVNVQRMVVPQLPSCPLTIPLG